MLNQMYSIYFVCFFVNQAAVEVPQYVGVNLLVEGLPVRRLRHLLHRQSVTLRAPIIFPSVQSTSEEADTGQKPRVGKENRAARKKKRQSASVSPKKESEAREQAPTTCCVGRAWRSLASEQPLVLHAEPQTKARRLTLTLGASRATLVPQTFSFSPNRLKSVADAGKAQCKQGRPSHVSRPFLPHTAHEHQHKTSTRDVPSLRGSLPALEVFRLRPHNFASRNSIVPSQSSLHRHQLLLCCDKGSVAKWKGNCTGKHRH